MLKFAIFSGALTMAVIALTTNVFSDAYPAVKTRTQSIEEIRRPAFNDLDQNRDEKISLAEADGSWLSRYFSQVDSDQDGYVSRDEYRAAFS